VTVIRAEAAIEAHVSPCWAVTKAVHAADDAASEASKESTAGRNRESAIRVVLTSIVIM